MKKKLNRPKVIARPNRDPDHWSKRQVPYWWAPEWVRGTSADQIYDTQTKMSGTLVMADGRTVAPCSGYSKIHAVKKSGSVELHILSRQNKLTYILGSIQREFQKWHEDRAIDYMLLGQDPEEIIHDATVAEE